MTHASWSSLDDATDTAEGGHVLGPALKERRHGNDGFPWEILGQDWFDLLHQVKIWVQLLLLELLQGLDLVNVEMRMSPAVKLVVDLEDPGRDVEVLGNQLRQRVNKLFFIINIDTTYWSWNISQLKDLLGS